LYSTIRGCIQCAHAIDEIATTSAISEAIKLLDDPQLQKTYLNKLLKDFSQLEHP